MFKILGETVSSMYSVKFHELISIGKNCFYRMLSRSQMDWRRLLATMAVHLLGILRRRDVDFYAGTSCFILDDTTVAKTTTNGELVSRVFDHVLSKCVLGYKVQLLCVSDGTTYKVHGHRHNAADLIVLYEREFSHDCRKYHCHYIALNGEYAKSGIKGRIFLIKYGRNRSWNILVTTDTTMSFSKAFETYQMRWAIEVLIKDCRQSLGFGKCQSNDFDSQLADVTITLMTYQIAALDLRFSQYETMGQLFRGMSTELNKLTLWNTMLECLEGILKAIAEACGWDMDSALRFIITNEEATREILFLARALQQYRAGADCIVIENVNSY